MQQYQIGLNIYTLYYQFISDMDNAFAQAAKGGYSCIEMIGDFNTPAEKLKALLQKNKIKMISFHAAKELFADEVFDKAVTFNKEMGNDTLVIPSFCFNNTVTAKDWEQFAAFVQNVSDRLSKHGIRIGYHNHAIEFTKINGVYPWDIVMSNTSKEVIMQVDIGNARSSGQASDEDIIQVLKRYPGRAKLVHAKPWSEKLGFDCVIGQDDINWPKIVGACKEYGGTETFLVEMEGHATTLERIRPCYDYLAGLVLNK